ncbi:helix-turn-helix transcriptional regulator [Rhodobacteraceae bacterium D3-12]|nr:helix-turn-helix transcriptional regulator [Rhodobacteraceae bacterium D3-12]
MDRFNIRCLRAIFVIQAICVTLFFSSTLADLFRLEPPWINEDIRLLVRFLAAIGLVLGTIMGWSTLRQSMHLARVTERKLKDASSAFMKVMQEHFDQWGLTPAESDVALFSLKGMTVNEIAELRGTSSGTVKAQTNAIYRKAGVSGRPQLLSIFIDDLIQDELPAKMGDTAQPAQTKVISAANAPMPPQRLFDRAQTTGRH